MYLRVYFNKKGIDVKKDFETQKKNFSKVFAVFRGFGLNRQGLSFCKRILLEKAFLIPRVTYALSLYPPGALSQSKMDEIDRLVINIIFLNRKLREVRHILLNSTPLEFLGAHCDKSLCVPGNRVTFYQKTSKTMKKINLA